MFSFSFLSLLILIVAAVGCENPLRSHAVVLEVSPSPVTEAVRARCRQPLVQNPGQLASLSQRRQKLDTEGSSWVPFVKFGRRRRRLLSGCSLLKGSTSSVTAWPSADLLLPPTGHGSFPSSKAHDLNLSFPGKPAELQKKESTEQHPFQHGDKVKCLLDIDILREMQEGHGGWNPKMAEVGASSIVPAVEAFPVFP